MSMCWLALIDSFDRWHFVVVHPIGSASGYACRVRLVDRLGWHYFAGMHSRQSLQSMCLC